MILALLNLSDETFAHSRRVQELAITLGIQMGLTTEELAHLRLGAFLHDIGKQFISPELLGKETSLTPEEWGLIEMHPIHGWQYVSSMDFNDAVKKIILEHHLWANGEGGYPLSSYGICPSLLTQITTVADVVDAMTSDRPYRPSLRLTACIDHLEEYMDTRFNRDIVRVLKKISNKVLTCKIR